MSLTAIWIGEGQLPSMRYTLIEMRAMIEVRSVSGARSALQDRLMRALSVVSDFIK